LNASDIETDWPEYTVIEAPLPVGAVDEGAIGELIGAGPEAEAERFTTSPALALPHALFKVNVACLRVFVNVHVIVVPLTIDDGTVNEPLVPLFGVGVTPLSQASELV
jgi:hypothetical protein